LCIGKEHLIRNGRDPNFRVWKGLGPRDSSDEEWEEHFKTSNRHPLGQLDSQVNTRDMVDNAFLKEPLLLEMEEKVQDIVTAVFALGDFVHEECREDLCEDDGADLSNMGVIIDEDLERQDNNDSFDLAMLEGTRDHRAQS
jgi:hypothetical protein